MATTGYAPYVSAPLIYLKGPSLVTPEATSSVWRASLTGGAVSTGFYLLGNRENSTPAGIATSFGAGSALGMAGFNMTNWAGLPQTAIPTTIGNAVIKMNTTIIGAEVGSVRDSTTQTGTSW